MTTKTKARKQHVLRIPQYRVLKALSPKAGRYPVLTRADLATAAGFRVGSGTISRALSGIAKGSPSGDPYPGLIDLDYIRRVSVPLDGGITENSYQATAAGIRAAKAFAKGREVGKVRSAKASTNHRYS